MSKTRLLAALALATSALAALPAYAKTQNTIEVGTCVSGVPTFTTIGAAVAAAASGTIIDICPGNYPEQITLTKNLTLTGIDTGGSSTTNSSLIHVSVPSGGFSVSANDLNNGQPVAAQLFVSPKVKAVVSGIEFDAAGSTFTDCSTNLVGVLAEDSTLTLTNSSVLNDTLGGGLTGCQDGEGILVESSKAASVTITGNHIAGFDKNGITIKNTGTKATVGANTIQGGGAATVAAQNGIEVADGATANVSQNVLADFVYGGGTYAASSILIYDAPKANISSNVINEGQYGIIIYGDGTSSADNPTISKNTVSHMTLTDSIEICGAAGASVTDNTISGSQLSAIHIDGSCSGSGAKSVSLNRINYACAGVLNGTGTGSVTKNTFYNTTVDVSPNDNCPSSDGRVGSRRKPSRR